METTVKSSQLLDVFFERQSAGTDQFAPTLLLWNIHCWDEPQHELEMYNDSLDLKL